MKRFIAVLAAIIMLPALASAVTLGTGSNMTQTGFGPVATFEEAGLTGTNTFAIELNAANPAVEELVRVTFTLAPGIQGAGEVTGAALQVGTIDAGARFVAGRIFGTASTLDQIALNGGLGTGTGEQVIGFLDFLVGGANPSSVFANFGLTSVGPTTLIATVSPVSTIPLPASVLLLFSALGGLGFLGYRKQAAA